MREIGRIELNDRLRTIVSGALEAKSLADERWRAITDAVLAAGEVTGAALVRLEGNALVCMGPEPDEEADEAA